jgi:hypothetical protein
MAPDARAHEYRKRDLLSVGSRQGEGSRWIGRSMRRALKRFDHGAGAPYTHSHGAPVSPRMNAIVRGNSLSTRTSFDRMTTQRRSASTQTHVFAVVSLCPPLMKPRP